MNTIYTIGHSNKPAEALVAELQAVNVKTVIDVRTYPRSRFNPQFNESALRYTFKEAGMVYEPRGKNIGGLAGNVDFDKTLDELVKRCSGGEVMALMCSEGDYHACHRFTDLTKPLMARGAKIVHVLYNKANVTETGERQISLL